MAKKASILFTGGGGWTAPAGVTSIELTIAGGGGGGAGGNIAANTTSIRAIGGGGGGAAIVNYINNFPVVPGTAYAINIGAGGAGGVYVDGSDGGTSSFGTVIAQGGCGGKNSNANPAGGTCLPGKYRIFNLNSVFYDGIDATPGAGGHGGYNTVAPAAIAEEGCGWSVSFGGSAGVFGSASGSYLGGSGGGGGGGANFPGCTGGAGGSGGNGNSGGLGGPGGNGSPGVLYAAGGGGGAGGGAGTTGGAGSIGGAGAPGFVIISWIE